MMVVRFLSVLLRMTPDVIQSARSIGPTQISPSEAVKMTIVQNIASHTNPPRRSRIPAVVYPDIIQPIP